jgi:hypothetical protein
VCWTCGHAVCDFAVQLLPEALLPLKQTCVNLQVGPFWGAFTTCVKWLLASLCLSVGVDQLGFHWTGFLKSDIWGFFENLPKFKLDWNLTRISGTECLSVCLSCARNKKCFRQKIKTRFISIFSESRAVCEIMWKKNTKCIISFPLHQWLRERATVLRLRILPVWLLCGLN